MRVRTDKRCFIGGTLREPGDVFDHPNPPDPLPKWLEEAAESNANASDDKAAATDGSASDQKKALAASSTPAAAERAEAIKVAAAKLDPDNDEHWTAKEGKAQVSAIEAIAGFETSRDEVDGVLGALRRPA